MSNIKIETLADLQRYVSEEKMAELFLQYYITLIGQKLPHNTELDGIFGV